MTPEEVEHYVRFNEPEEGPSRRLVLTLGSKAAVILLNEFGVARLSDVNFEGSSFLIDSAAVIGEDTLFLELLGETPHFEKTSQKLRSWEVYCDYRLIIPRKSGDKRQLPPSIGIVISGKEALVPGIPISSARYLKKDEPTPFFSDAWGDSWNSNYDFEPRIIESVPSTVFACITGILEAGKSAFKAQAYAVAASKYQKAFHYCHKFFPENLEDDDLNTLTNFKMRSLLGLAASALKLDPHEGAQRCIDACNYLLGMPECEGTNKAKALYRRGCAFLNSNDDQRAKTDFEHSLQYLDDPQTRVAITKCDLSRKKREEQLKKKLAGAFASA